MENTRTTRERLFAETRSWMPQKQGSTDPDMLEGVVVEADETGSDYGDSSVPVVTLEDDAGEQWRIVGYATTLGRALARVAHPGWRIAVGYGGMKEGGSGRSYHDFRVVVLERGPEPPAQEPAPGPRFIPATPLAPQPGDGPLDDEEPF